MLLAKKKKKKKWIESIKTVILYIIPVQLIILSRENC